MSPPRKKDPVKEAAQRRRREKRRALARLADLAGQGVRFKRHVFFLPGWDGDEGHCWTKPYRGLLKGHRPMTDWARRIVRTSGGGKPVTFLNFTLQESKASPSFYEFAEHLKRKIRRRVSVSAPIDLVGHSMGGLDIIAAVTSGPGALRNVINAVAVASPLRGVFYGRLVRLVDRLIPGLQWDAHHHVQVRNLDSRSAPIRRANSVSVRRRLLARVRAFTDIRGTRDMVVRHSGRLRTDGLSPAAARKVAHRAVNGASHTGRTGITQDPRTAVQLFDILAR